MSSDYDKTNGESPGEDSTEALTLILNRATEGVNEALRPGSRVGRYLIESQLGEGGMGLVFLAEQVEPVHRRVAIKISRRRRLSQAERIGFERERQALAQLQHPAIAQIFEADALDDGTPFFVMEYVEGATLLEFCKRAELSIESRVQLLRAICAGVQHAHQRGLLHCDLKPSNILVSELDGQPQPKIIDFGTARLRSQADAGRLLYGTLTYMAPEQAEADGPVDTRVDVFSLGALLHELLTGRALRQIETPDPLPPLGELRALLNESIVLDASRAIEALPELRRQELEAVIRQATAADPEERYGSVAELADDLTHWLEHRPVSPLPATRAYRLRRFLGRNALISALSAMTLLGLLGGLAGTSLGLLEAREQRRLAEGRQADLERVVTFQQDLLTELDMNDLAERMSDRLAETAGSLVRRDGGDAAATEAARSEARSMIERWAPIDAARDLVVEGILGQADELIAERHADNPQVEAALRVSLAQTLLAWQAFEAADAQIEQARAYYASVGDTTSRDALQAETEAVKLRWWLQRFPEAYELVKVIRPRAEDALGLDDDLSLYLLRAETSLSSFVEGASVAIAPGRILVDRLTELRGETHPETLRAEGDLLNNRTRSGSSCPDALIEDFMDHLQRAQQLERGDRQTLAVSSMNLGTCLAQNGQFAQAANWLEKATDIGRTVLGERHTITMLAINDRAYYLLMLGRFEEAEAVVDSLYANQRAIYGDDPTYLLYPRSYRAYIDGARGQAEDAIDRLTGILEEAGQSPETWRSFLVWIHRLISWIHEDALNDLASAQRSATAGLELCRNTPGTGSSSELCLLNELEVARLAALRGEILDPALANDLLRRARDLHPHHYARSLAAWLAFRFGETAGSQRLKDEELGWLLGAEPETISIIQQRIARDLRSSD